MPRDSILRGHRLYYIQPWRDGNHQPDRLGQLRWVIFDHHHNRLAACRTRREVEAFVDRHAAQEEAKLSESQKAAQEVEDRASREALQLLKILDWQKYIPRRRNEPLP